MNPPVDRPPVVVLTQPPVSRWPQVITFRFDPANLHLNIPSPKKA